MSEISREWDRNYRKISIEKWTARGVLNWKMVKLLSTRFNFLRFFLSHSLKTLVRQSLLLFIHSWMNFWISHCDLYGVYNIQLKQTRFTNFSFCVVPLLLLYAMFAVWKWNARKSHNVKIVQQFFDITWISLLLAFLLSHSLQRIECE